MRHGILKPWKRILLFVIALTVLAIPLSIHSFFTHEGKAHIGPFQAEVKPTMDAWVEVDAGPILPGFRYPLEGTFGLGVDIKLLKTETETLTDATATVNGIAANPEGEIAHAKNIVKSLVIKALINGFTYSLLIILFAMGVWRLLGNARQEELKEILKENSTKTVSIPISGLLILLSTAAAPIPDNAIKIEWISFTKAFNEIPEIDTVPHIDKLQISAGPITSEVQMLVKNAIDTFAESEKFYSNLKDEARKAEVRRPNLSESTALVITDRHSNIGMDPVLRVLADNARASLLLNLGDDTSSGSEWELFSVHSLLEAFKDYEIVSVLGNHDSGDAIRKAFLDGGVTILDGEIVEKEGLRLIGVSDPRSSNWGKNYLDTGNDSETLTSLDQQMTKIACNSTERPGVALVHSPSGAKILAETGCVPLILSGHLHRQVGPNVIEGRFGNTTTLTTGTTGGAAFALALGSKLRRDAQATILTYDDKGPVGLQIVTFTTGGEVVVGEYLPLVEHLSFGFDRSILKEG